MYLALTSVMPSHPCPQNHRLPFKNQQAEYPPNEGIDLLRKSSYQGQICYQID